MLHLQLAWDDHAGCRGSWRGRGPLSDYTNLIPDERVSERDILRLTVRPLVNGERAAGERNSSRRTYGALRRRAPDAAAEQIMHDMQSLSLIHI